MKQIPLIEKHKFPTVTAPCRFCQGTGEIDVTPEPVYKRADSKGVGRTLYASISRGGKIHLWRPHVPWHEPDSAVSWRACYMTWGKEPAVLAEPLEDQDHKDICKVCIPEEAR